MKIKLPDPLTVAEKGKIREAYEEAIKNSGAEEEKYVQKKFKGFLKRFTAPTGHQLLVIKISHFFYKKYFVDPHSKNSISEKGRKQIISALFYVVNPYDVIPDFIPARGYLDDAFVINLCLGKLRFSEPELCKSAEEIIQEQQDNTFSEQ